MTNKHVTQEQQKHVVQTGSTHAEDHKKQFQETRKTKNGEESQKQFRESRRVQNPVNADSDNWTSLELSEMKKTASAPRRLHSS